MLEQNQSTQNTFYREERKIGSIIQLGDLAYRIEKIIGSGGSTIVYEASYEDSLIKGYFHRVLIKELYPVPEEGMLWRDEKGWIQWNADMNSFMSDRKLCFLRGNRINLELLEKKSFYALGNMNSYEAYGTYYSVVSIHQGIILEDYIQKKENIHLEEALKITKYILDAAEAFHENYFLHLDISPDNVLLMANQAMLIDYNSSWNMKNEEEECFFSIKEGYCAPEILLRNFHQVGYHSDIFSIGCILFEMTTGKKLSLLRALSEGSDTGAHGCAHSDGYPLQSAKPFTMDLEGLYDTLEEYIDWLDKEKEEEDWLLYRIKMLFRRALHIIPRKRFQSTMEFRKAIDQLLEEIHRYTLKKSKAGQSETDIAKNKVLEENIPKISGIEEVETDPDDTELREADRTEIAIAEEKPAEKAKFQKEKKQKIIRNVIAGMVAIAGALTAYAGTENLRHLKVEALGNTNSNIYSNGMLCMLKDGERSYYVDAKGDLLLCNYDEEKDTFYLPSAKTIYPVKDESEPHMVAFLNEGKDKMYFVYQREDYTGDCLFRMDKDGTDQEALLQYPENSIGDLYTYASLSNGKEYIYYMYTEQEGTDYNVYRYNLKSKEMEKIITGNILWFNLYKDALYYTEQIGSGEEVKIILKKADLNGKKQITLDEKNCFAYGFVQDDMAILLSMYSDEMAILPCNLDGIPENNSGVYGLDLVTTEVAYDDGWIYYSARGEKALHRVRANGTTDEIIYEGEDSCCINCSDSYLFVQGNELDEKGEVKHVDSRFIFKTGEESTTIE